MSTAVPPDPFEDNYAAMMAEVDMAFTGSPFGYTDPGNIELQVAEFAEFLKTTPTGKGFD